MALIYEGICCALCDQVIDNDLLDADEFVATTAFLDGGPLWRFSDAAMHRSCFMAWEQREAFIEAYNEKMRGCVWGDGSYTQMVENGDIVTYNQAGEVVIVDEEAEDKKIDKLLEEIFAAREERARRKKEEEKKRKG